MVLLSFIDYIEIHGIKDDDDDDEIIEPTNVFADTAKHTDSNWDEFPENLEKFGVPSHQETVYDTTSA